MAAKLPGRTDNEIKNVWHTHIKKKLKNYQSTLDTEKQQTRKSEPQTGKTDSSTSNENDSLGYGSISRQNSSGELSSASTNPDTVVQELSISSKDMLSEIGESFWTADTTDQDLKVGVNIDRDFKCPQGDDGMDFWYNLFMTAEESPEF